MLKWQRKIPVNERIKVISISEIKAILKTMKEQSDNEIILQIFEKKVFKGRTQKEANNIPIQERN